MTIRRNYVFMCAYFDSGKSQKRRSQHIIVKFNKRRQAYITA